MKSLRALALSLLVCSGAFAQVTSLTLPRHQFFDANGYPLAGGKLYSYAAGTTTLQATYTDSTGTVANTNPVLLDSGGFANVWLSPTLKYKIVLQNSAGVQQWSVDNVGGSYIPTSVATTPKTATAYASEYCAVPSVPDETCLNNALASGFSTVQAVAAMTINNTVTIGAGITLELMPGTYTLGVNGKFALSGANSKLWCPGGSAATVINVPTATTVTDGIILINGTEPSGTVDGCQISFTQPDTATRSSLNQFNGAYAISLSTAARARVRNVKIMGAWNGVNISGNSGGSALDDLQIYSFHYGVYIDGPLDIVRLSRIHVYPFGATANQQTAFFDAANIGLEVKRCDGLLLSSFFSIAGTGMVVDTGTTGSAEVYVSHSGFENNGLVQHNGTIAVADSYFGTDLVSQTAIKMDGGVLTLASCRIYTATAGGSFSTNAVVGLSNASGNGTVFSATNVDWNTTGNDMVALFATDSGTSVRVVGSRFASVSNTVYTNATVFIAAGARLMFADNYFQDVGSGSGIAVKIQADEHHDVHDNNLLGRTVSFPVGYTVMHAHDNF